MIALPSGLGAGGLAALISEWVRCEEWISRAVELGEGALSLDHVWAQVLAGRAQLWPGRASAIVTRIEVHPTGLKALLFWLCGGDDLEGIKAAEEQLCQWGRSCGCARAEIVGRRGWLKALDGYHEGSTILVKEL